MIPSSVPLSEETAKLSAMEMEGSPGQGIGISAEVQHFMD